MPGLLSRASIVLSLVSLAGVASCAAQAPGPQPQAVAAPGDESSSDREWPREYTSDQLTFTVYQPQVESWNQAELAARAAVAVTKVGAANPEYGTIRFTARTLVDKEAGNVLLTDIQISEGTFPATTDNGQAYLAALRAQLALGPTQISLGRLEASLAIAQASQKTEGQRVDNTPPKFFYSERPAILVLVDGAPVLRPFGPTGLMRVLNTRSLIALDQQSGKFYLRALGGWARADKIEGPWAPDPSAPASLQQILNDAKQQQGIDLMDPAADAPADQPKQTLEQTTFYVSTAPAELIQTQGSPNFLPIPGTQVLYAENTEGQLLLNIPEQRFYYLVSGRWFRSASLQGGAWEYVDHASLPPDFARIPEEHPSGGVLASVANTPQAKEAVISNSIPQTAEIQREGPSLSVAYDGPPQFEAVEGANLQFATNTVTPVLRVGAAFYACDNAVWFSANAPVGPWVVAAEVPAVIYTIPVRHRLHFVTYCRVYRSTPSTVIVGYTPGYYGTLVAPSGCVVYGSGFIFRPHCETFWVPGPVTYGFGAAFNCGYRTGFAFGFTAGWLVGAWTHPYWGGFGWNHIRYDHFQTISFSRYNSFRHWDQKFVVRHEPVVPRRAEVRGPRIARPVARNNVVVGHDGAVYRRAESGAVERRDHNEWKPLGKEGADRERTAEVHRELDARGHGEVRTRNEHQATPMPPVRGGFQGGGVHAGPAQRAPGNDRDHH
jgi:hypothetical protein